MFIRCTLFLLFLNCVRTSENKYDVEFVPEFNKFSLWPSYLNAVHLLRSRRSNTIKQSSEGQTVVIADPSKKSEDLIKPADSRLPPPEVVPGAEVQQNNTNKEKSNVSQGDDTQVKVPGNITESITMAPSLTTTLNSTSTEKPPLNLNNPGVVKRGLIVFGGFALMAVAYFIFYRRKNKHNDIGTSLGMNDTNQFRYGMLEDEDMKDNLESSRIPLTMDSEDEIDEDLEIFDLVQKKKSLSYVNLQQNDEDIVLSPREVDLEGENLLLDIEDASTDALVNWSSNGKNSIL